MQKGAAQTAPGTTRVVIALAVVGLVVFAVWKVVDYRGQPPPPPINAAHAAAPVPH